MLFPPQIHLWNLMHRYWWDSINKFESIHALDMHVSHDQIAWTFSRTHPDETGLKFAYFVCPFQIRKKNVTNRIFIILSQLGISLWESREMSQNFILNWKQYSPFSNTNSSGNHCLNAGPDGRQCTAWKESRHCTGGGHACVQANSVNIDWSTCTTSTEPRLPEFRQLPENIQV